MTQLIKCSGGPWMVCPVPAHCAPRREDTLDHSPDGEPRALLARVGDLFPLDSTAEVFLASDEPRSRARPWGLRFARPASPRGGRHEGATSETTGSGQGDGNGPEDYRRD